MPQNNTQPQTIEVLHPTVNHPHSDSWDWKNAGQHDWKDHAREKTTEAIVDAMENNNHALIDALPAMGKSYGAVKATSKTGGPVTIATGRGHEEQYQQIVEWCEEFGLSYAIAPNFHDDCDTMNGEVGDKETREHIRDKYNRGATPQEIHKHETMPCEETQGLRCGYKVKWETLEPDETDVIIAHYNHLHVDSLVAGRHVILDEFPDAFEQQLHGQSLLYSVNAWLETQDDLNIENWNELRTLGAKLEVGFDEQEWVDERLDEFGDLEDDTELVFQDEDYYAGAPDFVYAYLVGERHQTGLMQANLPNQRRAVFNANTNRFFTLNPPDLDYAKSVIGLDGTPSTMMWEAALGHSLQTEQILNDGQRRKYVQDGMNMRIVRTSDYIKPYNNSEHVNVHEDAALFDAIRERHPERDIGLIGNLTALNEYRKNGVIDYKDNGNTTSGPIDAVKWYGNILGSNEFKDWRVGIIAGSQHFGDDWVKRWAVYLDIEIHREGQGTDLSYGEKGDELLEYMRESKTLQALFRFGRDGNGSMIYVHTNTLPDWMPVHGYTDSIKTWSKGERGVIRALRDGVVGGTISIASHGSVTVGERQTRRILKSLAERGAVKRRYDGLGYKWEGGNLKKLNSHGEVEFVIHDLGESEIKTADISRNTIYTLNVRRKNDALPNVNTPLRITSIEPDFDPFADLDTGPPPT